MALDEIWWLVSPQNPLKAVRGMAPYEARLARAREVANHPRIRVCDIERALGTRYTIDTIERLKRRFPRARFVWIMGADNLKDLTHWHRWADLFRAVPIATFDRWPYAHLVTASKPAIRFARHRVPEQQVRLLARRAPPAWTFFHSRLHPASATAIRAARAARGRT